ncbi:MAG TPA: hypothetical protein VFS23_15730, partial [Vicinamibacterales bacterium]|nr:hypothetical protein [Vicinamibacterales bacterium]
SITIRLLSKDEPFNVQGSEFTVRVQGFGFGVRCSWFDVHGSMFPSLPELATMTEHNGTPNPEPRTVNRNPEHEL